MNDAWEAAAATHLRSVCAGRDRRPGSAENEAVTAYAAGALRGAGWHVQQRGFEVLDWEGGAGRLDIGGVTFGVHTSPYSLGVRGLGPLVVASTRAELERRVLSGAVVLLHGALAERPVTPKGYPFYEDDDHAGLVALLEGGAPLAVIGATDACPELAGALRPFPLFEDGTFAVPAGYLAQEQGRVLMGLNGLPAAITLLGQRRAARACNVIARRGARAGRLVVTAHIDTKVGTPGALDNAAGVAILLLLAEMVAQVPSGPAAGLELVLINGEDYYAASGEVSYLAQHGREIGSAALAVNVDGAGYVKGRTAYSLYGCEGALAEDARKVLEAHSLIEGAPWWQGDHALFAMRGRPAIALTSERIDELNREVIHTAADTPALVSSARLVEAAGAILELWRTLAPAPRSPRRSSRHVSRRQAEKAHA
ncbi:MAG TPA: M28 family peptidase [Chloroflexota bacterium]|nr:M28 family peptidase [Chloroflexota bacterium]